MELYSQHMQAHLKAVEEALPQYLPASGGLQAVVEEAMGYACAAGGKRLRPVCRRAGDAPWLFLLEARRGGKPGLLWEAPDGSL